MSNLWPSPCPVLPWQQLCPAMWPHLPHNQTVVCSQHCLGWNRNRGWGCSAVPTKVTESNVHFGTLAECNPVNSKKKSSHTFCFETSWRIGFKTVEKKSMSCDSIFNTLRANFQMERMELQSDVQLKNLTVFLPDFYKPHLSRDKYPLLHSHASFMLTFFSST